MKILVTGGAGFIGSHVVDALIDEGNEVVVVDNLATGFKENLNTKANFFEVDVCDQPKLLAVFEKFKPEAVYHLAAQVSVEVSTKNPSEDVRVNVIGTINVLECCRKLAVKKFIFSSTGGAIYGDKAPRPTTEEAKTEPATPYGFDKLCAEGFVRFFCNESNICYTIFRFSNVYGERQNPNGEAGVIAILTRRMLDNRRSQIFGDGRQTRDYVYVGDIVRGLVLGLKSEKTATYNLATGIETSVNEIADKIVKLTGATTLPQHAPARTEQHASSLSAMRAEQELGWKPSVSLDEGLARTVDSYKNS